MAGASLSWRCSHVAVLRIGAAHHVYGDPYEWAATVIKDGATALIEGADRPITPSMWRATAHVLRQHGFTAYAFERKETDGSRWRGRSL